LIPMLLLSLAAPATGQEPEEALVAADEARFLTGLGVSHWVTADAAATGPALTWGLVLLPRRLDFLLSIGAMMGDSTYTVPVAPRFNVRHEVASWLDLFLAPGPTIFFDKFEGSWHHDFAISASGGASLSPRGYMWMLRISGDYHLRFWREVRNSGGFTVGFLYGF